MLSVLTLGAWADGPTNWNNPYVPSAKSGQQYAIRCTETEQSTADNSDWMKVSFNDSGWGSHLGPVGSNGYGVPSGTAALGYKPFNDGTSKTIYIRRKFHLHNSLVGKTVYMACGHDDEGDIWIDGTKIISWGNNWNDKYVYTMTSGQTALLTAGDHVIAIRAKNTSGGYYWDCGLYGEDVEDAEYTDLDYIGNINHSTSQYFNTGYLPGKDTMIKVKFKPYFRTGEWGAIFSGRDKGAGSGISLYMNGNGSKFGYFVGNYIEDNHADFTISEYTAECSLSNLKLGDTDHSTTKNNTAASWVATSRTITLFANPENDHAFMGSIYYFEIYEGNTLKHRFEPKLKSGGIPCFKCTQCTNHVIFPNDGASFITSDVIWDTETGSDLKLKEVEYIAYLGDEGQRFRNFDTRYVPKSNTKVEVKFRPTAHNNWGAIFSGRNKNSGSGMSLYHNYADQYLGYFVGNYSKDTHATISTLWDTDYTAICTLSNLILNGADNSTSSASWVDTNRSITLFSNPEKDQVFIGRIYYFRIYEGDVIKHNFIPVKANNGTVGFFDTIDGKYITTTVTTDSEYFTAPDPEVTLNFTYIAQQGSTQTEPCSNLFDGNVNTKWCWSGGHWSNWVVFHTDKPVYLKEYTLRTANDCVYRDPKKFKLYGALGSSAPTENGTTDGWTLIDSEDDANSIIPIERYAKAKFTVDNPGIYQYYMFKIEEVRNKFADGSAASSQEVQLAEFIASAYYDCLVFDENNDNTGINKTAYAIKLNRKLKADKWNTFCVPFNMDKSKLGESAKVKELSGATHNGDNYTMNFNDASTIEAGKPYMVKVSSEINSIDLFNESGIAVNTTGTPSVTKDGVTFTGVYTNGLAPRESFIISNNVFYLVDSDVTLKAFRGYITVDGGSAGVKALDFTFDDDATGISDLKDSKDLNDSKVIYNLAGQRLSKTQKGINIVNGKKIAVK